MQDFPLRNGCLCISPPVLFVLCAFLHPLQPEFFSVARLLLVCAISLFPSNNLKPRLTLWTILLGAGVNLTVLDCILTAFLLLLHTNHAQKDLFEAGIRLFSPLLFILTVNSVTCGHTPIQIGLLLGLSLLIIAISYSLSQGIAEERQKLTLNREEIAALREEIAVLRLKSFGQDQAQPRLTRSRSSDDQMNVTTKLRKLLPKAELLPRPKPDLVYPPLHRQFSVQSGIPSMSGSELSCRNGNMELFTSGESSISTVRESGLLKEDIEDIVGSILSKEYVLWHQHRNGSHRDASVLAQLQQLRSEHPLSTHSHFNPRELERIPLSALMEENEELAEVMSHLGEWDFHTLDLVRCTSEPLKEVAYYLFSTHSIPEKFKMSRSALVKFLRETEKRYRKENFYHNSLHAADVLNSVVFLLASGLHRCGHFLDLEVFSLFIAAIGHDICHPGVNNAFLINKGEEVALKYNDKSVLEMMHACTLFGLMRRPECNILSSLCTGDYHRIRKITIELILATDLQRHFSLQADYRRELEEEGKTLDDEEFRLKTLEILIKCSDLGHGAKETPIHVEWTVLITHEFFAQGDKERALGLPLSPLCDRHSVVLAKSQIGFLTVMVKPIFDLWREMIRSEGQWEDDCEEYSFQVCSRRISENLQHWECFLSQSDFPLPAISPPMLGL